jgi:hypothetical protein
MKFLRLDLKRSFSDLLLGCVIVAWLGALIGCGGTTHRTVGEPEGQPAAVNARRGMHYYLPRGKVRIVGAYQKSEDGAGTSFQIKTTRILEPDRGQRYFLENQLHAFFDDDSTLAVDENGLLQTVNSTSTDQTPAIIENAADIAINLFKIGANFAELASDKSKAVVPRPFVYTFDPLNAVECGNATAFLSGMGITLQVDPTPGPGSRVHRDSKDSFFSRSTTAAATDGVYYHPPVAVSLEFRMNSVPPDTRDSVTYTIPDYHVTECYSLRRAALIKQDTQLTFASGVPKQVKFVHPSQALAVIQIPQKIIGKVAEAIPAIIKTQSEAATRDVKNQTAVLQAQRDYLQAQIDVQKKQAEVESLAPARSVVTRETPANPSTSTSNNPSPTPTPSGSPLVQPGASPNPSP